MTTTMNPAALDETTGRSELRMLVLLAVLLLLTLAVAPFLSEAQAADTAVRIFALLLLMIAGLDALTLRVPNALVYPSIVFALAITAIIDPGLFPGALAGGGAALGIMVVLALLQRGAMGMGDVKAACFSGCILGVKGGVFSLLFGFAAAGVIALPLVLLRLRSRKDAMPLAPFLVIGTFISYFFWGLLLPGTL